ncbi:MAG: transcription termination/antitermination protein NusA, partial [Ilumatobacteraceae bacterium]
LAIGRAGINAKLAAQLCGLRLDVRSESEAAGLTVENTPAPVAESAASQADVADSPAEAPAADDAAGGATA